MNKENIVKSTYFVCLVTMGMKKTPALRVSQIPWGSSLISWGSPGQGWIWSTIWSPPPLGSTWSSITWSSARKSSLTRNITGNCNKHITITNTELHEAQGGGIHLQEILQVTVINILPLQSQNYMRHWEEEFTNTRNITGNCIKIYVMQFIITWG